MRFNFTPRSALANLSDRSAERLLTQAIVSNTLMVASDTLSKAAVERRVMVSWEYVFLIYTF